MSFRCSFSKYTLDFKFDAGTSRGVLRTKDSWFIKLFDEKQASIFGIGEASPLIGLSLDDRPDFQTKIVEVSNLINSGRHPDEVDVDGFPTIAFALETAKADLDNGGRRMIFKTPFFRGEQSIEINGLVWMGDEEFMSRQVEEKISQGYKCIKIKIGALDFAKECEMLRKIRFEYSRDEIEIRVDANGAFSAKDALDKLNKLAEFDLHSIEQPIKPGRRKEMGDLIERSPVPIAFDEELIGIHSSEKKEELLESLQPHYIILKPTLLGGMGATKEWIDIAERHNIGWWITSALESNIGLNAIAQFSTTLDLKMPQGLGTGQLFHNNIPSPLVINTGRLIYLPDLEWDVGRLNF
ncbi:MAG: o-succinylbenzoate synthase [Cytophagaceae bacterium]